MDTNTFLENHANKCYRLKICHELCVNHYTRLNKTINVLNITAVSFIAVSNNITTNAVETSNIIRTMYSIGLYFSVLVSALQQFLQYEKLSEKHRVGSVRYNNLYNAIMAYSVRDGGDKQPKSEFIKWMTQEFDILYTNTPFIPSDILKKFKSTEKDADVVFNKLKMESTTLGKMMSRANDNASGANDNASGANDNASGDNDNASGDNASSGSGSRASAGVKINDTEIIEMNDIDKDKAISYQMQRFMVSSYNE
jgi:hypothetical protein